jgi:hypothetical protein
LKNLGSFTHRSLGDLWELRGKLGKVVDEKKRKKLSSLQDIIKFRNLELKVTRRVETSDIEQLARDHLETLSLCQKPSYLLLSHSSQLEKDFRKLFNISWFEWNFNKIKIRFKRFLENVKNKF